MSTYGSIALVTQKGAYVGEVNGPDMMYSSRGKEICKILNKIAPSDLDYLGPQKLLESIIMYVNYIRTKRHEKSIAEIKELLNDGKRKTFLDNLGFSHMYYELKPSNVREVNLYQVGLVNGDGSEWTYIKNITNEPVLIPVYRIGAYDKPHSLYKLEPFGICCMHCGSLPNNSYNKKMERYNGLIN